MPFYENKEEAHECMKSYGAKYNLIVISEQSGDREKSNIIQLKSAIIYRKSYNYRDFNVMRDVMLVEQLLLPRLFHQRASYV